MGFRVAVVGATGNVGREMLTTLAEREFPVDDVVALASSRSIGKEVSFGEDKTLKVRDLETFDFKGIDIVLSSPGAKVSAVHSPRAAKAGAVVIDNTSYWRMDPDVPLVVPEVNPGAVAGYVKKGIIANPNCSTIVMIVPLWPLHKRFKVRRVVAATYQASSGAGATAMRELLDETRAYLEDRPFARTVIPHPYAFNLFPHNSPMTESGYCEEELKMLNETRKIFHDESIRVNATCIRVPVLRTHSEALNIEFQEKPSVEEVYAILKAAPGVEVLEDRAANRWPMPIDAAGKDPVFAGRVRLDQSQENTIDLWVVGDQIRKGAALNAIQIAELLFS